MARVLFFALLAMCLVCLIQGAPAEQQPAAATAGTPTIEDAFKKTQELGETVRTTLVKAVEDFNNNPHVKQVMESGKKLAEEIVGRVQTGIQAAIPKTE